MPKRVKEEETSGEDQRISPGRRAGDDPQGGHLSPQAKRTFISPAMHARLAEDRDVRG